MAVPEDFGNSDNSANDIVSSVDSGGRGGKEEDGGNSEEGAEWGNSEEDVGKPHKQPAYIDDKQFYRRVVFFLGWIIILGVGGMLLLSAYRPDDIPDGLIAIISTAVGALGGVLTGRAK